MKTAEKIRQWKVEEFFLSLRQNPEKYFEEPIPAMSNWLRDLRELVDRLPDPDDSQLITEIRLILIGIEFVGMRNILVKFFKKEVLESIKPKLLEAITEDFSFLKTVEKISQEQKEIISLSAEILKLYDGEIDNELYDLIKEISKRYTQL